MYKQKNSVWTLAKKLILRFYDYRFVKKIPPGFFIWKFQLLIFIQLLSATFVVFKCLETLLETYFPHCWKQMVGSLCCITLVEIKAKQYIASFLSVQYFVKIKNVIHMKIKHYVQKLLVCKLCCPKFLTFETPTNTNSTLYFQYLPSLPTSKVKR